MSDPTDNTSKHATSVLQLLDRKEGKKLSQLLQGMDPVDVVELVKSVPSEVQPQLLKHITGLDYLAKLITLANQDLRRLAIGLLDDARIAAVARRLEIDDAADLIGGLPRSRQVRILRRLGATSVKELTSLLAYPVDTAAGIMRRAFLQLPPNITAKQGLELLKQKLTNQKPSVKKLYSCCFIVDSNQSLIGVVTLAELLSSDPSVMVSDLVTKQPFAVYADEKQEKVMHLMLEHRLAAVPVISRENGKMLGAVTLGRAIRVLAQEDSEDLLKLFGTRTGDSIGAPSFKAVQSRLPLLLIRLVGGLCCAVLLIDFAIEKEHLLYLAFFIPAILGLAGSSGAQAAAISAHGFARGELGTLRLQERLRREAISGLALGVIFSFALAVSAYIFCHSLRLAAALALSVIIAIPASTAVSSMLPAVFHRLHCDPQLASSPLVSLFTDIITICVGLSLVALIC